MQIFKKKNKQKKKKKKEEMPSKFDANKLIEELKEKFGKSEEYARDMLFSLFKRFFRHYMHVKHNFTYEELNEHAMRNTEFDMQLKTDITVLSKKLSGVEDAGRTISSNELKFMIADFESIVSRITETQNRKKKAEVSDRLFAPFARLRNNVVDAYNKRKSKYAGIIRQTKEEMEARNLQQLESWIADMQEALRNGDRKKARMFYSEVRRIFGKLSVENKRGNYKKILDLYDKVIQL